MANVETQCHFQLWELGVEWGEGKKAKGEPPLLSL